MSTKISLNGSVCRSTIPKAITRATGLLERLEAGEEIAIRARPVCGSSAPVGGDIALEVSWGADVTGERIVELRPGFDRNSGQTKLRISKPLAVGWGLDGCQIVWEDHEMEAGETTTLTLVGPVDIDEVYVSAGLKGRERDQPPRSRGWYCAPEFIHKARSKTLVTRIVTALYEVNKHKPSSSVWGGCQQY